MGLINIFLKKMAVFTLVYYDYLYYDHLQCINYARLIEDVIRQTDEHTYIIV